jgi:hypothetical protein
MRFTDKDKIKELMKLKSCNVLLTDNDNKELKLGLLENIEEEHSADLLIFLKALKHGVFYKEFGENKIRHTNNLRISCYDGKTFCLENKQHCFIMKGHGKYWALTKEELLNESDND